MPKSQNQVKDTHFIYHCNIKEDLNKHLGEPNRAQGIKTMRIDNLLCKLAKNIYKKILINY